MIIVVGGIKGGTGKSTLAFHLAAHVHSLATTSGLKLITYDYDFPQWSFSKYYQNRKQNKASVWSEHYAIKNFEIPEFDRNNTYIIDTPGRYDNDIKKLHAVADVIITPINDSFLDIDTIMQVSNISDQEKWGLPGYYYESVLENKKNSKNAKWLIVRNRSSHINSKHKQVIEEKLQDLSKRLNFELLNGLRERNIFRELFTKGLTVLDIEPKKLTISHIAAKMEIKILWQAING